MAALVEVVIVVLVVGSSSRSSGSSSICILGNSGSRGSSSSGRSSGGNSSNSSSSGGSSSSSSTGNSVVRTTSYSTLAGLERATAGPTGRRRWVKFSAVEHSPWVSISMYPARAISDRIRSVKWLIGSGAPVCGIVKVVGM